MYLFSTQVVETEKIMTINSIYLASILLLAGRAVLARISKHGNTKCSQDLSCSLTVHSIHPLGQNPLESFQVF